MSQFLQAWELWEEGRCLELLDEAMECPYPVSRVLRCVQVGLLCAQEGSKDRPTMSEVVRLLDGHGLAERWNQWQEMESSDMELGLSLVPAYWIVDSTELLAAIELSGPR